MLYECWKLRFNGSFAQLVHGLLMAVFLDILVTLIIVLFVLETTVWQWLMLGCAILSCRSVKRINIFSLDSFQCQKPEWLCIKQYVANRDHQLYLNIISALTFLIFSMEKQLCAKNSSWKSTRWRKEKEMTGKTLARLNMKPKPAYPSVIRYSKVRWREGELV